MRLVRAALVLALVGGAALAAPPPPAPYPKELPRQIGGYDLPPIFAAYDFWIDRGRKAALDKAIAYEAEWRGKHYWGSVVDSELVHYDFGVIRVDHLERYCTGDWIDGEQAGDCDFRYRYAFVPGSLWSDEKRDKLIRESFRPEELTRRLSAVGWKQPENAWGDPQLTKVFEQHTDLAAFYRPMVEVHEVRSSTCPALARRMGKLGQLTLDLNPNQPKYAGNDFPIHGQQTQIRLTAATSNGGKVIVEGAKPLFALLEPVWAAVEQCSPPSYKKERAG